MNYTIVGADIAKNVMQLYWVDPDTGEITNKAIKRAAFLEHFANRSPCLIGMEACGGAQHWARRLLEMGHQVKLIPAKFAKAFNIRNKNDAADARAIWMATQMPGKSGRSRRRLSKRYLRCTGYGNRRSSSAPCR
jgi:transposase